ncbi:hypothetical protein QYF61_013420 [Mycteria americana]|uniref:Uncharacterized protein n=1 Tax=Mycteria americana TaxID=33587 RepID=A0AAN7NRF9_MYCAM|nr:hypothetical protein QYF61_013420 [Mycteria americana]
MMSRGTSLAYSMLLSALETLCCVIDGWRLNHFPGQPVPMLDSPFREVKFPNIPSKPPLAQLEAISSRPITCYLGEETDPHLSTPSFQAKQPQLPQPLLIRLLLQSLHQLRCPSLGTLQHLNVSLVVGGPKPNTVFESLPPLKQINTPAQLGVICKLTEGALDPLVQIIDKDIKQDWPQHRALGDTTCDRPPNWSKLHSPPLLGPSHPASSLPSEEYTRPSHEQPVSPGECCGKQCQRNDRMVEVGRDLQRSSGPTPLLQQGHLEPVAQDRIQMAFESLSPRVLEGCYKFSLEPSLLQAEQPQLSQTVFIGEVLQPSDHLRGPPLDSLQQLHVLLMLGAPELNTVLQDTVGFLGCKCTLPGHVELLINQHPQVILLRAALNPFSTQPVFVLGIAPTHVQDLALGLVELHEVCTGPPLKPVKVSLDGILSLQCVNHSTQLGIISKLAEDGHVATQMARWPLRWPANLCNEEADTEELLATHYCDARVRRKASGSVSWVFSKYSIPISFARNTNKWVVSHHGMRLWLFLRSVQVGLLRTDSLNCVQAKQSQLPQPLLIRLLLQTLHQLRCPSLDTLQHLSVSLVVRGPKLNTVFQVQPHQCRVQGHDHFPSPAGHAISDTSQDAIGLFGHLGTLLAHIQVAVDQHSQVLFWHTAFQPLFPKPVALHGVVVTQVQDPALGLVEPHTIGLGPSIQPVQVPLQSLPPFKQINTPAQLAVVCKLTEGALDPFIQIIDKDIKQNWPQY